MIIELFGPPGAGKTTFAHALTTRLQESGHIAQPMLSNRPSEGGSASPAGRRVVAVPRRLSRPFIEVLAIACHPFALSHDIGAVVGLMKILPPQNAIVAMRLSQYILRLSHSWRRASAAEHIVLFDQAFLQLICSLVLLGRSADESLVAHALDAAPRPDLAIRIDTPPDALETRLKDRASQQSVLERLFELDLDTNLKSIGIIDQLYRLLIDRSQLIVSASSLDRQSINESVRAIERTLVAQLDAERKPATRPEVRETKPMNKLAT